MVDKKIEEFVGLAATRIAKDIGASGIITIEQKKVSEGLTEDNLYLDVLVTIFKKVKENTYTKQSYSTKIKSRSRKKIQLLLFGYSRVCSTTSFPSRVIQ